MKWNEIMETPYRTYGELEHADNIVEKIKTECSQALEAFKASKDYLWRGFKRVPSPKVVGNFPTHRQTRDTEPYVDELFNDHLVKLGFMATRRNSLMCSTNRFQAETYGKLRVVFPTDNSYFTYSEKTDDFWIDDARIMATLATLATKDKVSNDDIELLRKNDEVTALKQMDQEKVNLIFEHIINRFEMKESKDINEALKSQGEVMVTNSHYYALRTDMARALINGEEDKI